MPRNEGNSGKKTSDLRFFIKKRKSTNTIFISWNPSLFSKTPLPLFPVITDPEAGNNPS